MAPVPSTEAPPLSTAAPQASVVARLAPLLLRILTLVLLLIALIILTTNTATLYVDIYQVKFEFNDVYTYRYMLSTMVLGAVYMLIQTVFEIVHLTRGSNSVKSDTSRTFNFYGDKMVSYILVTGAAAGFGATKDLEPLFSGSNVDQFFQKGYASASMLLLAFVCSAAISVISSYSLPKRI